MLQICYSENPKCSGKVACLPRSYGPVQIKIIILQFYTHTFQKAIFYANLWLTKLFVSKKIQIYLTKEPNLYDYQVVF